MLYVISIEDQTGDRGYVTSEPGDKTWPFYLSFAKDDPINRLFLSKASAKRFSKTLKLVKPKIELLEAL
jgi:hypothetical protein